MPSAVTRKLQFATPERKAAWLGGQARLDAMLRPVQQKALRFLNPSAMARVLDVFAYVRDEIRYVRDPPPEQFADAAVILARGFDDCDGKARTLCALLTAAEHISPVGVECELVPVFPMPGYFSHVAARVRWPKSHLFRGADADGWVRAETILKGVNLGEGSESAQRDSKGNFVYT